MTIIVNTKSTSTSEDGKSTSTSGDGKSASISEDGNIVDMLVIYI